MKPHLDGLIRRGLDARGVALPVGKAERAIDAYRSQVADLRHSAVGGHSFGGRVASLMAAVDKPRGLVLLSYPLHRPGHPDEQRTEHWSSIGCPVLLLSGESDPFARLDLLRAAVRLLPNAELVTYQRVGHGHGAVLDDALDRVARFVEELPAAD